MSVPGQKDANRDPVQFEPMADNHANLLDLPDIKMPDKQEVDGTFHLDKGLSAAVRDQINNNVGQDNALTDQQK